MVSEPFSPKFALDLLRSNVKSGQRRLRITTHAQTEAFKDGLLLADLRHVFEHGKVIETYPEERRWLLHAHLDAYDLPVHIVVEDTATEGVIVTAYIPDRSRWLADRRRRR